VTTRHPQLPQRRGSAAQLAQIVEEEAVGRPSGTGGQLAVGQQGSRRARRPVAKRRERESRGANERRERGPPTSISSCRIRQTHRADGSETSGRRSRVDSAGRSRARPPALDPPLLHHRRGQGRLDLGAVGPSSRPASGHRGRRSAPASPPPCSTPPIAAPHHRPAPGRPRTPASLPGSPRQLPRVVDAFMAAVARQPSSVPLLRARRG
jgi:hypothetical protein